MIINTVEILWSPAGRNLSSLGSRNLVDISDGDSPNVRMPIRMLSIDTPEITAQSESGAKRVDEKFAQLSKWLKDGTAPVTAGFRDYILPKLEAIDAGTLQYNQGQKASVFCKSTFARRLQRPDSNKQRSLFLRSADEPFDQYGRLLAYVAPSYSKSELDSMTRLERATFNLDLIASGWAAPFVIFPSIPGELDLLLFLKCAKEAETEGRGQYANPLSMPGYEYRMCEKLYRISKKLADKEELTWSERFSWRSRYCADMRTRNLFGPEEYMNIPPAFRLWIWPDDVRRAIGMLNLIPQLALEDSAPGLESDRSSQSNKPEVSEL